MDDSKKVSNKQAKKEYVDDKTSVNQSVGGLTRIGGDFELRSNFGD